MPSGTASNLNFLCSKRYIHIVMSNKEIGCFYIELFEGRANAFS